MFRSIDASASGLIAQRQRMDVIAGNLANVDTTRDESGKIAPFQRRFVEFYSKDDSLSGTPTVGVKVDVDRQTPPRREYDPGHPDAVDGFVSYPAINPTNEMVDAIAASRAYEANLTAVQFSRQMIEQTMKLLQ